MTADKRSSIVEATLKAVAAGYWSFVDPSYIKSSALVFAEPKKGRVCVAPTEANDLLEPGRVTYDSIEDALNSPDAYLTRIDWQGAFPHIPIALSDRPFTGIILSFEDGSRWHLVMNVVWFGSRPLILSSLLCSCIENKEIRREIVYIFD